MTTFHDEKYLPFEHDFLQVVVRQSSFGFFSVKIGIILVEIKYFALPIIV